MSLIEELTNSIVTIIIVLGALAYMGRDIIIKLIEKRRKEVKK